MADEATGAEQLASDFKKDELVTAAAVTGVDVPSGATKAEVAEALSQAPSGAAPVTVDNRTARSDSDAYHGSWVDVVSGEHAGRRGALLETVESEADGYPKVVSVRTRDADNLVLHVAYKDVRPSEYTGGR